jgi:hypothetical protein
MTSLQGDIQTHQNEINSLSEGISEHENAQSNFKKKRRIH